MTKRQIGVILLGMLLAAGAIFLGVGPASSHFDDSRVTIRVNDKRVWKNQRITFSGQLLNDHRRCYNREWIILKHKVAGEVTQVRRTLTNQQGEWSIRIDPKPNYGKFRARYNGKSEFAYDYAYNYDPPHTCGADRSRTIRIQRAG